MEQLIKFTESAKPSTSAAGDNANDVKRPISSTEPPKELLLSNVRDPRSISTISNFDELQDTTYADEDWDQIIPMDSETYAKQSAALQEEIDLCEDHIAKLERKQRVGSQTCISKIIKQRREIRDLQAQVFERKLNEKLLLSPDENLASPTELKHFDDNLKKTSAIKLSHPRPVTSTSSINQQPTLQPAIEDTAEILDAVPPPPDL